MSFGEPATAVAAVADAEQAVFTDHDAACLEQVGRLFDGLASGQDAQVRAPRRERLAPVLLPEERCIGEARAHHALVALAHLGRIAVSR